MERAYETKNTYVEQAIRDAVARGEIRPGMWLRSEEWAGRLKTSLTPVREALRKLEAEGIVRIYPHRGAQVVRLSRTEFEEVFLIRGVLEGLAASQAVTNMNQAERDDLLERLAFLREEMHNYLALNELAKLRAANKEFHFAIYEAAESPRLYRMIENLWATFPWDTLSLVPGRPRKSASEHDEIIDAVKSNDPSRARDAVVHHIDLSARDLLQSEGSLGLNIFEDDGNSSS